MLLVVNKDYFQNDGGSQQMYAKLYAETTGQKISEFYHIIRQIKKYPYYNYFSSALKRFTIVPVERRPPPGLPGLKSASFV